MISTIKGVSCVKVAKQAIKYYTIVTGNDWSTFFNKIDESVSMPLSMQTDEAWLIHSLLNTITDSGMTLTELKANKDAIKAEFDEEGRKLAGEFFTPIIWAEEAHKYLDTYIPNWRTECNVWENSFGSGNLVKTAGIKPENLYMSTLQQEDVDAALAAPEFKDANIFQCDFLADLDYDVYNTEFLNKLPPRLKEIIINDEPLVIFCNPPYKSGSAKATDIGRYMIDIGIGKAAYDIFYQFCYRVMRFVELFNLSNCYYAFFGPLTYFTGANANVLLKEFEHCFEFLDGMCISAQEFSDTSDSIIWGIGFSVWKSRGGHVGIPDDDAHKDIFLERKFLLPDGSVGSSGKVLYEPPREKLSSWIIPKDVSFYKQAPLMTSHLTFKDREVFDKEAPKSGRLAVNALGTLMAGNTLTRSADQSAILSMPATIQFVDITEENFWRCVASFCFRRTFNTTWDFAKSEISAPNTNVEGYDLWLRNALVLFLFDYKSLMSALRDVKWQGELVNIHNKLFYLSEEEIRANCTDPVILADLDKHPLQNQFMLKQIEESMPYWVPQCRQLFDWCKALTLASFDGRKSIQYKGSSECADASFYQLRTAGLFDVIPNFEDDLAKLLAQARDYLKKDLFKFGFVYENNQE